MALALELETRAVTAHEAQAEADARPAREVEVAPTP